MSRHEEEEKAVLGLLVVLLRALRHWSQTELARASGIQKSQISLYELGKTAPSEVSLKRLAAAAGITWAAVRQVLPALRTLVRLGTRPEVQRPDFRRLAAAVGRAAAGAFQDRVSPFLQERLPILAGIDPAPGPRNETEALDLLIVLLRSLRHWTQEELADASGVQRSQVSAYEQGKKVPRNSTLERLAAAVGVPLEKALEVLPFLGVAMGSVYGEPGRTFSAREAGGFAEGYFRLEVAPFLAERLQVFRSIP